MDIFLRRLQQFTPVSEDERRLLASRAWKVQRFGPHTDLIGEGSDPRFVNVVLEGWACRYKQLEDGRRQILALFLPGDMCDPCVFFLDKMSHALGTLTPATVARIPESEMMILMGESANLRKAFWLDMLVSTEVQREWTVSLGRRTATERMAHLFCEILMRLQAIGLADASGCDLPITQADLGDALGLSAVHVNRTLQDLRAMKLLELRSRRLVVHDADALRALALFSPDYLHLSRIAF